MNETLFHSVADSPRTRAPAGDIRVLIVDDSLTARSVLSRIVSEASGLTLAGAVSSAEAALTLLARERTDVVLLDLEMPGMGGLAALPLVQAQAPQAKVLVVSRLTADGVEASVAALASGAADTLLKPEVGGFDSDYRETLVARIVALGRSVTAVPVQGVQPPRPRPRAASRERARIVAIGASTGGIHALGQLLRRLPDNPGVPVLVTQHLLPSFNAAFRGQLRAMTRMPVVSPTDREPLLPGHIYVAPGDAHICVVEAASGHAIRLDRRRTVSGCMPSLDPMFESIARTHRAAALGVVLTGMGRDGFEGARIVCEAGGTVLAQDEASSAVWGMPGAVVRGGLASDCCDPRSLGDRVGELVRCTIR